MHIVLPVSVVSDMEHSAKVPFPVLSLLDSIANQITRSCVYIVAEIDN